MSPETAFIEAIDPALEFLAPATVDGYQLFHDSLRSWLIEQYPREVTKWRTALVEWCQGWSDETWPNSWRRYAVAHQVSHRLDLRGAGPNERLTPDPHGDAIIALAETAAFQQACVALTGNADALRTAIDAAQGLLLANPPAADAVPRFLALMTARQEVPRLAAGRIRDHIYQRGKSEPWWNLINLARIGSSPRDRVLLLLLARYQQVEAPAQAPPDASRTVQEWLDQCGDPALALLWRRSL